MEEGVRRSDEEIGGKTTRNMIIKHDSIELQNYFNDFSLYGSGLWQCGLSNGKNSAISINMSLKTICPLIQMFFEIFFLVESKYTSTGVFSAMITQKYTR